ncbi:MAG: lipoyl(octanoyl) transferase LipB [Dehalococcoidia bacterium]
MGTRCTLLRPGIVEYQAAWRLQQRIVDDVRGGADSTLILLEHPPTYTLGARGNTEHLLLAREAYARRGAAVVQSDRGGDVTFHGPGQMVGYPIIDLRARGDGPLRYVQMLEATLIDALRGYGIDAGRREGARGVWAGASKIAAIGVRVSRGVTMHGFALNVNTDLSYFADIVPCGIRDGGVTSMREITGETFHVGDVMRDVASAFSRVFGVDFVEQQRTENRQQRVGSGQQTTENNRQQRIVGAPAALADAAEATSLRSGGGAPVRGGALRSRAESPRHIRGAGVGG